MSASRAATLYLTISFTVVGQKRYFTVTFQQRLRELGSRGRVWHEEQIERVVHLDFL